MTGKNKRDGAEYRRYFDFADFMENVADIFEDVEDTITNMMDSAGPDCGCGPQIFARMFCCEDLEKEKPKKRTQKV